MGVKIAALARRGKARPRPAKQERQTGGHYEIARYLAHGSEHYGVVEGDNVTAIEGSISIPHPNSPTTSHKLADVQLLAPVAPGKILAMGLNYTSHIGDRPAPEYPMIFHKTPTSVIGPGDTIIRPKEVQRFDAEGEMVVVIKDTCRYVTKADALNHVLGYTCGNDVSARDWQRQDRNENNSDWWRAKSADTFSPMGPWIETEADPSSQWLQNPRQRQRRTGPKHRRPDFRCANDDRIHHPLRNPERRRLHFHRHAGHDAKYVRRRSVRNRHQRHRSATQPGAAGGVTVQTGRNPLPSER